MLVFVASTHLFFSSSQAEIAISVYERDSKTSDVNGNHQNLVLALNIATALMSEVTGGKKLRAGDIARAKFILACVFIALHRFSLESKEASEAAASLLENMTWEQTVSLLRDAKEQFEQAGEKSGVTDVTRYCEKYDVGL